MSSLNTFHRPIESKTDHFMKMDSQPNQSLYLFEALEFPTAFTPLERGKNHPFASWKLPLLSHIFHGLTRTFFGARPVVMAGKGAISGQGSFRLIANPDRLLLFRLIARRGQILFGRTDDGETVLANFCQSVGLDRRREIEGLFSFNDAIVLFGEAEGRPAVAHVGYGDAGIRAVQRHHSGLLTAGSLFGSDNREVAPQVINFHNTEESAHLIQSRLPDTAPDPKTLTDFQFEKAIKLGAEFLRSMPPASPTKQTTAFSDLFSPKAAQALTDSLPDQYVEPVSSSLERLEAWIATSSPASVPVHGDYWLRNILLDKELTRVTGLIDWEWARERGLPLSDLLHLVFMSNAMRQNCHIGDLLPQIWHENKREPWVHNLIEEHRTALGLSSHDVSMIGEALWLRYIWQGHVLTWSGGDEWLSALLDAPIEAIRTVQ